jgi:hypothetical protein
VEDSRGRLEARKETQEGQTKEIIFAPLYILSSLTVWVQSAKTSKTETKIPSAILYLSISNNKYIKYIIFT